MTLGQGQGHQTEGQTHRIDPKLALEIEVNLQFSIDF